MRRIVTILSVLSAAAMTLILTASAASAQLVAPVGDASTDPSTQAIHHGGLASWQMALILVAAVILIGVAVTLVARRVRIGSHRPVIS
jgi:hypothetical protein